MIQTFKQVAAVIAGLVLSSPIYAVSCGDPVSGVVNLTQDLHCNSSHGLVVTAPNTTINLNGFTISCTGTGFKNSCQRTVANPASVGFEGIKSIGFSGVTVNGPGVITGFTIGVHLINGQYFAVNNVAVDGPLTPSYGNNTRGDVVGIEVGLVGCPFLIPLNSPSAPAFSLTNNFIADQTVGISLQSVACGMVSNNTMTRNAQGGANGSGWGIEVLQSSNVTLFKNNVMLNATGNASGGGIHLASSSTNIHVTSNEVGLNCGNGIYADGVGGNKIQLNTAQNNGVSWSFSQCRFMAPWVYTDFAETEGVSNTWTYDNVCDTQTQGTIAYGVCKKGE